MKSVVVISLTLCTLNLHYVDMPDFTDRNIVWVYSQIFYRLVQCQYRPPFHGIGCGCQGGAFSDVILNGVQSNDVMR